MNRLKLQAKFLIKRLGNSAPWEFFFLPSCAIALSFAVSGCAFLQMSDTQTDENGWNRAPASVQPDSGNNPYADLQDDPYYSNSARKPAASWTNSGTDTLSHDQQVDQEERQKRLSGAISHQDIVLGMDQHDVIRSWGSPRDVETAGSRSSGNERWIYYSVNSLNYGMGTPRIVYFEQGRVVGWQSSQR